MAGLRERNIVEIRRRITEAADAEFAAKGYAATTMEAVADRAGVSVRSLYNHYDRKEMLFLHDFGFHVGLLKAAANARSTILEAVRDYLKTAAARTDTMVDIGVRAFDMLLWERLEQELAQVVRTRQVGTVDDLAARTNANLIVAFARATESPEFVAALSTSGRTRAELLDELATVIAGAVNI